MKPQTTNEPLQPAHLKLDHLADPIASLADWRRAGLRSALVTLIDVDGSSPRPVGSQMAVCESGTAVGQISGGCLEYALIHEAFAAMAEDTNRLLTFGNGSPFLDIRLPCGSKLDVYIDQRLRDDDVVEMSACIKRRRPFVLRTNLESGDSSVQPIIGEPHDIRSERQCDTFVRLYQPATRLMIFGMGPAALHLATLSSASGLETELITPDEGILHQAANRGLKTKSLLGSTKPLCIPADRWTSAILMFHDHDHELPLLKEIIGTDCFYIGAVGSSKVHERRLRALRDMGATDSDLSKIRGPAGVIKGAKSATELAVGILAEIMSMSRQKRLVL